jgi:hypothetical protein
MTDQVVEVVDETWTLVSHKGRDHLLVTGCGETFKVANALLVEDLPRDPNDRNRPHPIFKDNERAKIVVRHFIAHQNRLGRVPELTRESIETLLKRDWLPARSDQINQLIRYVGERTDPGSFISLGIRAAALIGAVGRVVGFLSDALKERGLIAQNVAADGELLKHDVALTLAGWERYDELTRGKHDGRLGFIAMPFRRPELDDFILPVARAASEACGFRLRRADDFPISGSIDAQIRSLIRESRFVVADLTFANLGAYWEAGYAEGLGIPVIYSVRKDHDTDVHFDTSHLSRIVWEPDKLDVALLQLKAMIRNSLPDAVSE